jgi:hypothetical protein
MDTCSKDKLETFSKKHYTYINQIFGDATVREIIEENYPTKYVFNVEETGAEFEFSYHHTVKTKVRNRVLCSVEKGHQKIHKNFNDTLCQSYSLMNYFGIKIATEKKRKQMAMIKMYRDLINGNLNKFKGVDFKKIINDEILKDKRNKRLWKNFVTDKGYINMNQATLFSNIEQTLNEWESFGYWFFIGKGECPKHSTYSSEMRSQAKLSRELSQEFMARHEMGEYDNDVPKAPTPKPKSASLKSKSASLKPKSVSLKSKTASLKPKSATLKSKSASLKPKSASLKSKSASLKSKSASLKSKSASLKPKSQKKMTSTHKSKSQKKMTSTHKSKTMKYSNPVTESTANQYFDNETPNNSIPNEIEISGNKTPISLKKSESKSAINVSPKSKTASTYRLSSISTKNTTRKSRPKTI